MPGQDAPQGRFCRPAGSSVPEWRAGSLTLAGRDPGHAIRFIFGVTTYNEKAARRQLNLWYLWYLLKFKFICRVPSRQHE